MSDAYTTTETQEQHEAPEDERQPHAAFDPLRYAGVPPGGYEPHPLFPREDDSPELRDIHFVSFRRRSSDGVIDNLAEDVPAGEVLTWADVVGPWGGGEYKAIGKDKNHRIVAWYPERNGEWVRFDLESKPFTLRADRYRSSALFTAFAAMYAPPMVAAPPANPTLETAIAELVRELRAVRPPACPPPPAPHPFEAAMVEMIKSQGELLRAVLGSVLAPRHVAPSLQSNSDPMTMALQVLDAVKKLTPPQTLPSCNDRLSEYRTVREPSAPNAPSPSEFGELKDLVLSVMRADTIGKSTREVTTTPSGPERRPPPPRMDDRTMDFEALLRNPTEGQRQRLLATLGLDRPVNPATAVAAAPRPEAPDDDAGTPRHDVRSIPHPEVAS